MNFINRSLLMSHICGLSKWFGEWYQKTKKTEDTNKLTLLAFKIITILHNTLLATFIKLLKTVSKCLFRNRSQNRCHAFLDYRPIDLYDCNYIWLSYSAIQILSSINNDPNGTNWTLKFKLITI
jgi:hypothetical protein